MAFDQIQRTPCDLLRPGAGKNSGEHLVSKREDRNEVGIAAYAALFELGHLI